MGGKRSKENVENLDGFAVEGEGGKAGSLS